LYAGAPDRTFDLRLWSRKQFEALVGETSPYHSLTAKKANKKRKVATWPVSVEKCRFTTRFFALLVSWLLASLVSSGEVHAVAICGVG